MLSVLCVLHEVAQDVSRARDEGLRWPVRCCLPLLCGWRLRRSRRLYGWTLTVSTCSVVLRVWWSRCTVTRSTVRRSRNVLRPCAHSGGAVFEFALPKLRATQLVTTNSRSKPRWQKMRTFSGAGRRSREYASKKRLESTRHTQSCLIQACTPRGPPAGHHTVTAVVAHTKNETPPNSTTRISSRRILLTCKAALANCSPST